MKRLIFFLIFLVCAIGGLAIWWNNGIAAVRVKDQSQKIFVIEKGQGIRETANALKREGLIRDPIVFFLLVKQMGIDGKIQAGDFRLSPSMSAAQIAENLTHGTLDIWVTIPEGKRAEEIADILQTAMPKNYKETWQTELIKYEGYLFPDTYLIPTDADVDSIVSLLTNTFENKFAGLEGPNKNRYTKEELVIVASLVEREAKLDVDRPIVASVIFNRLDIGMRLQIDATVQYILGYQPREKSWWKRNLTIEDLRTTSPYNTYTNSTLPPTPIANPGLAALLASVSPANTNYIYYISDSKGNNHYAETLEEHNANIKKYGL